jgi:hypothetical protein
MFRNSIEPFFTRKNMPPWGILVRSTIGNPAYKFFKSIKPDCNFCKPVVSKAESSKFLTLIESETLSWAFFLALKIYFISFKKYFLYL